MLDFTTLNQTFEQVKDDIQAYSDANGNTESGLNCVQSALDCSVASLEAALGE